MQRAAGIVARWGAAGADELRRAAHRVRVCGRVASIRTHGPRLAFADVVSDGTPLQAVLPDGLGASIKRADIIALEGTVERTSSGVLSVRASALSLLRRPAENAVPDREVARVSPGPRSRDRHLQMLTDASIGTALRQRATIMRTVRAELDGRGFFEVETPMLGAPSGAAADAFVIHGHAETTLRVSLELRLKQLVVGGMDAVYELGRCFRDEGDDATHAAEFTLLEAYCAHADLDDAMALAERLVRAAAAAVGSSAVSADAPFERVDVVEALKETGLDILPHLAGGGDQLARYLAGALQRDGVPDEQLHALDAAQMLDRLLSRRVERRLSRPTFLSGHPLIMSPLASADPTRPSTSLRAELFVSGLEVANMYDELGDAAEQERRLAASGLRQADADYVHALRAGLPPCAGLGVGVDRLAMVLLGAGHIRDVVSFPR